MSNNTIQDVIWSSFRAEGPSTCLSRNYPCKTLKNIVISNTWIEKFALSSLGTTESELPTFYDALTGAQVGVSGFMIEKATVGQIDVNPLYATAVEYQYNEKR